MKNKWVVCTSSNDDYFPHLLSLINSFGENNDGTFLVRAVNMSKENINRLKSIPYVQIREDNLKLSRKKDILSRGVDGLHPRMNSLRTRLCSEDHCYCAHSKFKNAAELLSEGFEKVLILDADTIIRKNIDPLFDMVDDCDLAIDFSKVGRGCILPEGQLSFKEGLMLIKNTEICRIFFKKINLRLDQLRRSRSSLYDIDSDHVLMAHFFEKIKNKIRIKKIPKTYKDTDFKDESHMWSGKGDRKTSSEKYVQLKNYYLNL
tara:strand:- start:3430 stop:4212 length:783 start_codon:yes stop_codon:yes gene_type:complete